MIWLIIECSEPIVIANLLIEFDIILSKDNVDKIKDQRWKYTVVLGIGNKVLDMPYLLNNCQIYHYKWSHYYADGFVVAPDAAVDSAAVVIMATWLAMTAER